MQYYRPRVLIGGLKGGAGKTTLTLGLLRTWQQRGSAVLPFKKGPDYIDAAWLSAAAKEPCYNLDSFFLPEKNLLDSFTARSAHAEVSLIEGNRGIFDGVDAQGTFSSAALAKLLASPVVLVVDCVKTTSTMGAIVKGIKDYDRDLDLKAVVLNYVANERHRKVLTDAVESIAGVPVLGALRKEESPVCPERHMGLVASSEYEDVNGALDRIASLVSRQVDEEKILHLAANAPPLEVGGLPLQEQPLPAQAKIAIVRDMAFQFYYPENLEELVRQGAELVEISALEHQRLPEVDALYIGGGFPETNALGLSENTPFLSDLRNAIERGLPVYAECGGLMFLGRTIVYGDKTYPMAGIFPVDFVMEKKPQAHGYTIVEVTGNNPYFQRGTHLKGHEFHYSRVARIDRQECSCAFTMKRGKGIAEGLDGLTYKNVLATYTHLHALGNSQWTKGLMAAAMAFKETQNQ